MSRPKPSRAALSFLFIFSIASFKLSYCTGKNGIDCPRIEKHALLSFKQSLKDPNNQLSSRDGEVNCCKWKGVVCNNLTGHVHQLQVHGLSGKISPSLLNLTDLRYLDLSQNEFGQKIPSFIGSFTNLEYLNLSDTGFHGNIPQSIGNLSNLHTLCLQGSVDGDGMISLGTVQSLLEVEGLEWLSGLSQLEYLNMNYVNLSKATNWAQVINTIPSLVELHFKYCSLDFVATLSDVNLTYLAFLDLSYNLFHSFTSPRWISQLSHLVSLNLRFNYIKGPIPTFNNATKLQSIDLSANHFTSIPDWLYIHKDLEFVDLSENKLLDTISNAIANLTSLNYLSLYASGLSGKIPKEIASLCKIQYLDLSFNELQGETSGSFGNMSECFLGALEFLSLESNELSGHLTDQFGEFKSLETLILSDNSLSGAIPSNLGKLKSLEYLQLEANRFTGNLPESLGQLFNLRKLDIANNKLEGVVTESHFANLTKLETFSASGNHLTWKASPEWIPPFQLATLRLKSWNLGAGYHIPSWLEKQNNISELDLSDTGISSNVPSWFWEIQFLTLSHNHLHFKIPYIHGHKEEGPQFVYLSSNQFSGSLPRIGDTVKELDLSNNSFSGSTSHFLCDRTYETYGLEILHLGGNQLSGELPDCWMKWPSLRYLSLDNNNVFGNIPNSIRFLQIWSL